MNDYSPEQKPLFQEEAKDERERIPVKGKSLEFKLEEKEIAALGKEAADLQVEIVKLEGEFENAKQDWKDRIAGKKNEFREKLRVLHSGKQVKTVDCIMVKDFEKNTIEYEVDGKVIESRAMDAGERQAEIPTHILRKAGEGAQQDDRAAINAAFSQGNSQVKDEAEQRLKDAIAEQDSDVETDGEIPQTSEPCDEVRDLQETQS